MPLQLDGKPSSFLKQYVDSDDPSKQSSIYQSGVLGTDSKTGQVKSLFNTKGLTRSEAQQRENIFNAYRRQYDKADFEKRREIIDAGKDIEAKKSIPEKIDDVKAKAGEIAAKTGETVSKASKTAYDHIASNLPAYGGAAVAGLGAYGLYKYLKGKKEKKV